MQTLPLGADPVRWLSGERGQIYLNGSETVSLLQMVPLEAQVEALVKGGLFEEALALCELCPAQASAGGIDVPAVHERCVSHLCIFNVSEARPQVRLISTRRG